MVIEGTDGTRIKFDPSDALYIRSKGAEGSNRNTAPREISIVFKCGETVEMTVSKSQWNTIFRE